MKTEGGDKYLDLVIKIEKFKPEKERQRQRKKRQRERDQGERINQKSG